MKKILIALLLSVATVTSAFGRHHHHFHHHHGYHFGYGAPIAFGTGLLLGSALSRPVPVAVPSYRVWVPGYYVTNYDSYGRPYQTFIPGHWEYR